MSRSLIDCKLFYTDKRVSHSSAMAEECETSSCFDLLVTCKLHFWTDLDPYSEKNVHGNNVHWEIRSIYSVQEKGQQK